jgi:hypothetical protein
MIVPWNNGRTLLDELLTKPGGSGMLEGLFFAFGGESSCVTQ